MWNQFLVLIKNHSGEAGFLKEHFDAILTFIVGVISGGLLDYFFISKESRLKRKDAKNVNKLNFYLEEEAKLKMIINDFRWSFDENHKMEKPRLLKWGRLDWCGYKNELKQYRELKKVKRCHKIQKRKLKRFQKKIRKLREQGILA